MMNKIKISELRPAFAWLVKKMGRTRKEVAEFFGVRPNTVGDAITRYEEREDFGNRRGSGRRLTATTNEKKEELEQALAEDPHTRTSSTRKLARRLEISRGSVRNLLKKGGYRPWKDQKRQMLSEAAKKKRRERCPALLERFGGDDYREVLFTDEKLFTVEQAHNPQNDRTWSRQRPSLARRVVQRAVKPESVMVWAGVGHDKKTPLIFVAPGVKINGAFYREMLEREVVPWMDALPDPLVFQQDGAPAHTAKETQDWCQAEFFDFVRKSEWPPSSPDLNPMDFSIWSILEARACANPHKSVESLINALKREWEKLDQETINAAVAQFPSRLQQCIDAEGGHFE
jgi:transposase